jgi:hypothetical protein
MNHNDKAALTTIVSSTTAASGLGNVTLATITTTKPACGVLGWLGFTSTTVTTFAVPVAGVVLVAGLATWAGYRVYKAMRDSN